MELHLPNSRLDRRNGNLFSYSYLLIFLAAPVLYVGVVQAALCDRLGASATVANLLALSLLFGKLRSYYLRVASATSVGAFHRCCGQSPSD